MLTPDERAAMRERHWIANGICAVCHVGQCEVNRLLDALDEAERRIEGLRDPSDEVVEAVSAAFARTAAENSELHFEADRTFELAWKDEARAAIAALADALGVESGE